jgi:hypothetical protein
VRAQLDANAHRYLSHGLVKQSLGRGSQRYEPEL